MPGGVAVPFLPPTPALCPGIEVLVEFQPSEYDGDAVPFRPPMPGGRALIVDDIDRLDMADIEPNEVLIVFVTLLPDPDATYTLVLDVLLDAVPFLLPIAGGRVVVVDDSEDPDVAGVELSRVLVVFVALPPELDASETIVLDVLLDAVPFLLPMPGGRAVSDDDDRLDVA